MRFNKSITIKLTFWYTLVTFISSILVLFVVNFVYLKFVNRTLEDVLPPRIKQQFLEIERGDRGNMRFREILREIRNNDVKQIQKISFVVIAGNLLVATTGGYLLAQQMIKPIRDLNKKISEIGAKNLNKKLDLNNTGDEIEELIKNFNKMTDRLYRSFKEQEEFVANASHELKTPLAIIQTNIEATLLDESIDKENRQSLNDVLETISKTNSLLEDLLLLSSIQNNTQDFKKSDLSKIIRETISDINFLAREKQISIDFKVSGSRILLNCNDNLLGRAISNILENAIKYSPPESKIKVFIDSDQEFIKISILDEGPGISESDSIRIFDRFYRTDKSRSRKTGGHGLGLPIAKEIIDLHKGEILVNKNEPTGAVFSIILPKI